MDLRTDYLGLELKNPLVPSSSPLSRSVSSARQLEDAGASALVMYSLFQEEVEAEEEALLRILEDQNIGHAEADCFFPEQDDYLVGLDAYLEQLEQLKQALDIPVVASLNGYSLSGWVSHAKELEASGADAIELNIYHIATNVDESIDSVESFYLQPLRELKQSVNIPLTLKLTNQFHSLPAMVKKLQQAGASGVSLFNRLYQPDIDIDTRQVIPSLQQSTQAELHLAMRWVAILRDQLDMTLSTTGGVQSADDIIKLLLAGADVTHVCSVLLKHGPGYLRVLLDGLQSWMEHHEIESLDECRGNLSRLSAQNPEFYERANYMRILKTSKSKRW